MSNDAREVWHKLREGFTIREKLGGYCPHPRAPGALALSLDRERDLEKRAERAIRREELRGALHLPSPRSGTGIESGARNMKVQLYTNPG
jgi:hypothetical protein